MMTQKDKQQRGAIFEREVAASLRAAGYWVEKLLTGFSGTPFDHVVISPEKIPIAIECKTVTAKSLPYSRLKNKHGDWKEPEELDKFMKFGTPYLLCNYKVNGINECYVIPWANVRELFWHDVKAGISGSIPLSAGKMVPRIKITDKKYGFRLEKLL